MFYTQPSGCQGPTAGSLRLRLRPFYRLTERREIGNPRHCPRVLANPYYRFELLAVIDRNLNALLVAMRLQSRVDAAGESNRFERARTSDELFPQRVRVLVL